MGVDLEDNSVIDQNKVKKTSKAKGSNKEALIITTDGSNVIEGGGRHIGVGSCMKGKEKEKATVRDKVGMMVKATPADLVPKCSQSMSIPK